MRVHCLSHGANVFPKEGNSNFWRQSSLWPIARYLLSKYRSATQTMCQTTIFSFIFSFVFFIFFWVSKRVNDVCLLYELNVPLPAAWICVCRSLVLLSFTYTSLTHTIKWGERARAHTLSTHACTVVCGSECVPVCMRVSVGMRVFVCERYKWGCRQWRRVYNFEW